MGYSLNIEKKVGSKLLVDAMQFAFSTGKLITHQAVSLGVLDGF